MSSSSRSFALSLCLALASAAGISQAVPDTAPATSVTISDLYHFGSGGTGTSNSTLVQGLDGNYYGVSNTIGNPANGSVVFKLDATTSNVTILHTFDLAAEGIGGSSLAVGPDGTMYGVTSYRYFGPGDSDGGVFYSITTGGTFKSLHVFSKAEVYGIGANGLTLASDGNLYVVSTHGGANGIGGIAQLSPSGAASLIYSFDGTVGSGQGNNIPALVQARDGNFYGAAPQEASDSSGPWGTIYKMVNNGNGVFAVSVVHNLAANGSEGETPTSALVVGPNGSLYGTTFCGGSGLDVSCGDGTIVEVTTAGVLTKTYDFATNPVQTGVGGTQAFTLGSDQNFYGITYELSSGSSYQGTAYAMTPAGAVTAPSNNGSSNTVLVQAPLFQGSTGSYYTSTLEGSINSEGYGNLLSLTFAPAQQGPVQLSATSGAKAGVPFTLSYTVSNAFSRSLEQCYVNARGNPSGAGASALPATNGTLSSAGYAGSIEITPTAGGTYTYSLTCGGIETGFLAVAVGAGSEGTSISASATPDPVVEGANVTLNVNVSSATGTPAGSVNFVFNGQTVNTIKLNASGNATWKANTAGLPGGTYNITVNYVPSDSHLASHTVLPVTIVAPSTTTVISATPAATSAGQNVVLNVHAALTTGPLANGGVTVTLVFGTQTLSTQNVTTDSKGNASVTLSTTGFSNGVYGLRATLSGNSSYQTSTGAGSLFIGPANQAYSLPASILSAPLYVPRPPQGLIQASDGNFYGTQLVESDTEGGDLFSLSLPGPNTPSGVTKILTTFAADQTANIVTNGFIEGVDGNFYADTDTTASLAAGYSTLVRITPSGQVTGVTNSTEDLTQSAPPLLGSDGNYYTWGLVFSQNETTFNQITPSGTLKALATFTSPAGSTKPDWVPGPCLETSPLVFFCETQRLDDGTAATVEEVFFTITAGGKYTLLKDLTSNFIEPVVLATGPDNKLYGISGAGFFQLQPDYTATVFYSSQRLVLSLLLGSDGYFYTAVNTTIGDDSNTFPYGAVLRLGTDASVKLAGQFYPTDSFAIPTGKCLTQGSDGNLYLCVTEATSDGTTVTDSGDVVRITPKPALAPPVQVTLNNATITLGQSVTLSWSVLNAFSTTAQVCTAHTQSGAGAFAGILSGKQNAGVFGGTVTITPTQDGRFSYGVTCGGNESNFATLVVNGSNKNGTAVSLATVQPQPTSGSNVTLIASVSSATGIPNGSVQFSAGSQSLGSATLDAHGMGFLTAATSGIPAGKYPVTSSYAGTQDYAAASKTSTVTLLSSTQTTLTGLPSSVPSGTNVILTVHVQGAAPTGTVVLLVNGLSEAEAALNNQTATFSHTFGGDNGSTFTVQALYAGDSANGGSKSPGQTIMVTDTPPRRRAGRGETLPIVH